MAEKRIIIVTNQYKNIKSGVGTVANVLINQLSKNFSVLIICPRMEARPTGKNIELATVNPLQWDITNHHWVSFGWEAVRAITHLRQDEYELVVFMDAREGLFSNHLSIPSVGIIHDFMSARFSRLSTELKAQYPDWLKRYVYYKMTKIMEEKAYKRLDHLVTVSEYARSELERNYKIGRPVTVIRNGLDFSKLPRPKKNKQKNSVAFICGNPYLKGLPQLLKAVEIVAQSTPDIKCYVIGNVKGRSGFEQLSSHVIFTGHLDYKDAMKTLSGCEIFCMPSRFESYGMVYIEALYYDMQVVASQNTGMTELQKNFVDNLHVVDPDNIGQLATTIKESLGRRNRVAQKSLDYVSSERMCKEYVKLIKKIVNEGK